MTAKLPLVKFKKTKKLWEHPLLVQFNQDFFGDMFPYD